MDILQARSFSHLVKGFSILDDKTSKSRVLDILYKTGLLIHPSGVVSFTCIRCNAPLRLRSCKDSYFGWRFICTGVKPHFISPSINTFFKNLRLNDKFSKLFELIYMWVHGVTFSEAILFTGCASETCVAWYRTCRRVAYIIAWHDFQQIGGKGDVVEVAKTQLFNKAGPWVLGGLSRTTKKIFLLSVKERNVEEEVYDTMIQCVDVDSTIVSNESEDWAGFRSVFANHFMINQNLSFVSPPKNKPPFWLPAETLNTECLDNYPKPWPAGKHPFRAHVNTYKRFWRTVKETITNYHKPVWTEHYLGEIMYRKNVLRDVETYLKLGVFLRDAARVYPGPFKPAMEDDVINCQCHECQP